MPTMHNSMHAQYHVADALFELLHIYGVKNIFGVPGDELELFDALCHSKISFITTRHEQGAAFMASAVGKIGPIPGVCISTLGPGATNLVTGIADAYQNRIPIIALSGQLERKKWNSSSALHQYIDLPSLFSPITKATFILTDQRKLVSLFSQAFKIALSDRPGPVHITLPADVIEELYEGPILELNSTMRNRMIDKDNLNTVKLLLSQSSYPLIFFGQLGQCCDQTIREAIQASHIPVITSFLGKGSFPESSPLSLGTISRHINDSLSKIIEMTDLIICIGFDPIEGVSLKAFGEKKIILVDVVDAGLLDELQITAKIVCERVDISYLINSLLHTCLTTQWNVDYLKEIKIDRQKSFKNLYNNEYSFPFSPPQIMEAFMNVRTGNEIIVSDVGIHKQVLGLGYRVEHPFEMHFSNGLSSMGFSLPFAAGLRFSVPSDKNIISICGDGGFLMNIQELETIYRYNLNIKIIIFVDNAFGMIKANLLNKFYRVRHLDFTNPDYADLASSFHFSYFHCEKPNDLKYVLERFLCFKKQAILPLRVKYFS